MDNRKLNENIISSVKWSTITEIIAKLASPITNMVLARILVPDAFGIVATITMIISFADMLTDAGFQKYLVQHDFKDENEKLMHASVAFWTNLGISVLLWFVIIIFREQISMLVGNPGLGKVLVIACVQLIITSFSSIHMALYRREFDFKTLFLARIVSIIVPFVLTIPLALLGLNYWALIIGTTFTKLLNALIMIVKAKWKFRLKYSFNVLKEMLSFSIWSLVEAFSIWLTVWIDAFIIGNVLSQYYLGLYKTSITMVNTLMATVTASTVPVLFSALSRVQNDAREFNKIFFKSQRLISSIVMPLGVGIYLYSKLATEIFLGSQWNEASGVIGIWGLTSSIMIVFGHYCSEVYRAKGKPKLSFLAQVLHLIVLIPVCIISSKYGFWSLVYSRSLIRIQSIVVHFILMKAFLKFPIEKSFVNVFPTIFSSIIMGIAGFLLKRVSDELIWDIFSIAICSVIYFVTLFLFPIRKKEIIEVVRHVIPKKIASRYNNNSND